VPTQPIDLLRDPARDDAQMDFSEFETARSGIWRICAVIDYATKYCLAATVTPTSRGQDALGGLRRAVVEAERVLETAGSKVRCAEKSATFAETRHPGGPSSVRQGMSRLIGLGPTTTR
jgi:hypothetical protein